MSDSSEPTEVPALAGEALESRINSLTGTVSEMLRRERLLIMAAARATADIAALQKALSAVLAARPELWSLVSEALEIEQRRSRDGISDSWVNSAVIRLERRLAELAGEC